MSKIDFILHKRGVATREGAVLILPKADGLYRVETRRQAEKTKYPQEIVGKYFYKPSEKERAEFMSLDDGKVANV